MINIKKYGLIALSLMAILLVFILPGQLFKLHYSSEIFPGLEIAIIYYLNTHRLIKSWQLFLLGFVMDTLLYMPYGTNSFVFLSAQILVYFASKWLILEDYLTNVTFFAAYSLYVIILRYFIVSLNSNYDHHSQAIYFYYLTTLFAYPITSYIIAKILHPFKRNHVK